MKNKNVLRKESLEKRKGFSKKYVNITSSEIISKLEDMNIFKKYNNIAIYDPISNEVDLLELIKKYDDLLFPKYNKNSFVMEFVRINNEKITCLKDDIQVIIVPGIAFDKKGNRLGFGKGYYDRYLEDYKGIKIGITYKELLYDTIPALEHDVKMDFVIVND